MMEAEFPCGVGGGAEPGVGEHRGNADRLGFVPAEYQGGSVRRVGAVIPDRLGKEGVRRSAGQTVDDDREGILCRDRLGKRDHGAAELPVQADGVGDLQHL